MTPSQTKIEPRFENGRSMLVAGLRASYTMATADGIPALWQRFVAFGRLPNMIGNVYYGACFPTPTGFDYMCCVEVPDAAGIRPELTHVTVPAQRYAVFAHREHVSKLRHTLDYIWHNWFPTSGYKPVQPTRGAPAFYERYGEKFNPVTGMDDIEVWMPIS